MAKGPLTCRPAYRHGSCVLTLFSRLTLGTLARLQFGVISTARGEGSYQAWSGLNAQRCHKHVAHPAVQLDERSY